MGTVLPARGSRGGGVFVAWAPVVLLPLLAAFLSARWPAWQQMWLLAVSIYAGFKWLTFATSSAARRASLGLSVGYLFLWTGMDAEAFFSDHSRRADAKIAGRNG